MTLGKRIKERREQLGLTQGELAALIGTKQPQVSRYEQDESQPTAEVILALAKTLKVSADWLLGNNVATHMEGLNDIEQQALSLFRSKPLERQSAILEILRLA